MPTRAHHVHEIDDQGGPPALSRRAFLGGLGAGAVGLLIPALGWATTQAGGLIVPAATTSKNPYRLAMHVHSSFSEGVGSMYAQLTEAARTGHDLVFFTEHDWRRKGLDHLRRGIHFTGASEVEDPAGTWKWTNRVEGSPAARSQSWVSSPSSPTEPGHTLQVGVTAPTNGTTFNLFDGDDSTSSKGVRVNVSGQRLQLDVRLDQASANGWLELRLYFSFYPAVGGYPKGYRTLSYRFGTLTGRSRDASNPLLGIVWMPVPVGTWTTVELRPLDDLAAIFTELPAAADNATTAQIVTNNVVLTVGAGARSGGVGRGWFDRLRFLRDGAGAAGYDLQEQLIARYAAIFPTVRGHLGDEISRNDPHLQWLVGRPVPLDYDYAKWPNSVEVLKAINGVHQGGGLLQYNHPFGAEASGSFTDQNALLTQAVNLMKTCGAWPLLDLVEAGYQRRGTNTNMASLDTHLRLFDLLARARRYVTCTGCTDDHEGLIGSWSSRTNRYATGIWAPSLSDVDVKAARRPVARRGASRSRTAAPSTPWTSWSTAWCRWGRFPCARWRHWAVQLTCPTVPSGATAEFIRGVVDGNATDLTHRVTTFATASTANLRAGTVSRTVDTTSDCFVRAQIRNSAGTVVAFSNPIWLFRADPPGGIPANRRAPDVPPGTTTTTAPRPRRRPRRPPCPPAPSRTPR